MLPLKNEHEEKPIANVVPGAKIADPEAKILQDELEKKD